MNKDLLGGGVIANDIAVNVSGCSYSISHNNPVKAGTLVTITFTASSGYTANNASYSLRDATGQTINWDTVNTSSTQVVGKFIMPAKAVSISCTMKLIPTYSISVSSPNASVRLSKSSGIRAGEVITVTITPNSGYNFTSISSSPSVSFGGSGTNRTFTMPSSNVKITVTCVKPSYSVRVSKESLGSAGQAKWGGAVSPNNFWAEFYFVKANVHSNTSELGYNAQLYVYKTPYPTSVTVRRVDGKSSSMQLTPVDGSGFNPSFTGACFLYSVKNLAPAEGVVTDFITDSDVGKTVNIYIDEVWS